MKAVARTRIAERIAHLGTETAFAVSAEAAAFAAAGNEVYAFHLGDLDLATPGNVVEASFEAIRAGKTGYCPNAGIPELREALAADVSVSHGVDYAAENVVIEPGGKPVIGKFILALMNPGDEVLYPNPGYPIYESQIEFHGGIAVPYGYREGERDFALDLEALEAAVTPRTRLLIVNDLQNPMGAECSAEERARLASEESEVHLRQEVARLEGLRGQLANDVENMARHLEAERNRLRASLNEVLKWVDENVQPAASLMAQRPRNGGVRSAEGRSERPAPRPESEQGAGNGQVLDLRGPAGAEGTPSGD